MQTIFTKKSNNNHLTTKRELKLLYNSIRLLSGKSKLKIILLLINKRVPIIGTLILIQIFYIINFSIIYFPLALIIFF